MRPQPLVKRVQNTKSKVQSSIRYTPEGTDTGRASLIDAAHETTSEVDVASARSIELCTTPVASGGEAR
jgi:hypothetical protein